MSDIGRQEVTNSPRFVRLDETREHDRGQSTVYDEEENEENGKRYLQTPTPFGLNRWIYLLVGCMIVVVLGPLVMNWGEIASLLEKEGAYLDTCDGSTENKIIDMEKGTCKYQESILGDIGILSQALFFTGALVGGCIMDQFGPKVVGILGSLGFSISFLLLGISSNTFRSYYAFGIIQGFSVELSFYSVITIPNLFPKHRALILSILGVARSLSMLLAMLLNRVRTEKFNANKIGYTFCAISVCILLFCAFFVPKKPFKVVDNDGKVLNPPTESKRADYKLWAYTIGQPFYMIWILCYALIFARTQFHIISIAEGLQHADVRNPFGYLAGLSFVFCPPLGYLIDYFGAPPIILGLDILGSLAFVCLISGESLTAQWFAVIFLTIVLSFLGSQNYALVQERYIERVVGKLCGLVTCCGGLFSFTNTPIWHWAKLKDNSKGADGIYLIYSGITIVLIAILWWAPTILFVNPCFPDAPNASIKYQADHAEEKPDSELMAS